MTHCNFASLQIQDYNSEKEKQRQAAEDRDQRRLEELKRIMREQALYDNERSANACIYNPIYTEQKLSRSRSGLQSRL